ncbi:PREDICTED: zinc finger protein jing homolog [Polistes canadensis]|uniref:zinc finger protein jing homolog n=1 Tax=Polistes canadensis TaxID=91411 RepID=UPI000718AE62|nr:PREDICTED: zinc finger protein jing homolog [Polistes canadensis]
MADGPSAEEASAVDVRILSKERHKRQDASSSSSLLANAAAAAAAATPSSSFNRGQDVLARRNVIHGDPTTGAFDDDDDDNDDDDDDDDDEDEDEDDYNQVDTRPRRYHHDRHKHHHYRYQQQQQQQKQQERIANEGAVGVGIGNHFNSGAGGGEGGGSDGGVVGGNCASTIRGKEHSKVLLYDEEDYYEEEDEDDEEDDDEEGEDGDEEDEEEEEDYMEQEPVEKRRVRLGLKKSTEGSIVTSVSSVGNNNNNRNSNASVGGHVGNGSASALLVTTMLGNTRSRLLPDVVDVAVDPSESVVGAKQIKSNLKGRSDGEENNDNKKKEIQYLQQQQQQQQQQLQPLQQQHQHQHQQLEDKKKRSEEKDRRGDDTTNDPPPLNTVTVTVTPASPSSTTVTTSGIANGVVASTGNSSSSSNSSTSTSTTGSGSSVAGGASNIKSSSSCAGSLSNDSPFKGQVRMAEETLVGPCGKKRCADRYDSSESSDSGVAVSCGECSSSGTSDITEPGSPCSTSSDEGVAALRGASASPLPSLPKLAPSSQLGTRPQWPWTPLLATTACSTYKKHKGEPEAGTLPRSGAADPTSRGSSKANGGSTGNKPVGIIHHHHHHHHHHESSSQGKITEYFKSQIKPPQSKLKKTSETMSVLVAKSSSEFRRPPTVQRNKGGLAKYLGTVPRTTQTSNDWEIRTVNMSPPPPIKKTQPVIVPRTNAKIDKKLITKPLPSLPISNDVLKNIPPCKISSLRLTSEASPSSMKPCSPPSTPIANPPTNDYKGCILTSKPHVNENNNLTNGCPALLGFLRSQNSQGPLSRLSSVENEKTETQTLQADEEDVEEEEDDSRSSESKTTLSPILSAPTTIRFPARAPEKDRSQHADSGICRWDKCEASFESSTGLLEHLQVAHINTQTGGDNFVCHWLGCKVQGRTSCSRRWLERHVLSHGGNKPFRCIVDGCGSRFSSQTTLERHVNGHFNQPETSSSSGRRSCENGGKLVRRNGKRLRYRRQPWSARLFDYFDSGVMEGLQHRLFELAKSRTQGRLAETPGDSMALTSQVLARRVEMDGKVKVLLRWYPQDIEPDEWVLESEVQSTKHVRIRKIAGKYPEEVSQALYPAMHSGVPSITRVKQRRKPVKNS